jgi:hypothetical protein
VGSELLALWFLGAQTAQGSVLWIRIHNNGPEVFRLGTTNDWMRPISLHDFSPKAANSSLERARMRDLLRTG